MPINYDEIIKKAEARRAALQEYADAMAQFNDCLEAQARVFNAAHRLSRASQALDPEAVQLLDSMTVARVKQYAEKLVAAHLALDEIPFNGEKKTFRQHLNEMIERTK